MPFGVWKSGKIKVHLLRILLHSFIFTEEKNGLCKIKSHKIHCPLSLKFIPMDVHIYSERHSSATVINKKNVCIISSSIFSAIVILLALFFSLSLSFLSGCDYVGTVKGWCGHIAPNVDHIFKLKYLMKLKEKTVRNICIKPQIFCSTQYFGCATFLIEISRIPW